MAKLWKKVCATRGDLSMCGAKHHSILELDSFTFLPGAVEHVVDKKCRCGVCKNLLTYTIEKDQCFGCGMCAKACPAGAISKTDYTAPGKKLPAMAIDTTKCVKCGACMGTCKFKALVKK